MTLANGGTEQLEDEVGRQTPERVEELVKIFIHGTKVGVLLPPPSRVCGV